MLSHFLTEDGSLTINQHKIIHKVFLKRRKYNPFHLDCQYTKKKLCYCKKNPICQMSQGQKANLWQNSYLKPYEFFSQIKTQLNKTTNENSSQKDHDQQQVQKVEVQAMKRRLQKSIEKIKLISREQAASFIKQKSKKVRRGIAQSEQYPRQF